MGIITVSEQIPDLALHRYPSAALWRELVRDIQALDEASRAGRPLCCGGFGHPQEFADVNPMRKWWGGFRFLSGMTTISVVTRSSDVLAGDVLRCWVNGTVVDTWDLADGEQTHTTAIGGLGLVSGAPVEVMLQIYSAEREEDEDISPDWGLYEVWDAWAGPVAVADSWPGLPTLSDTYAAADLSQLTAAVDWLARWLGRRTDPLFQAPQRWPGPYGPAFDEGDGYQYARWYGDVVVVEGTRTLSARGHVWVNVVADEQIDLVVDGASVATYTVPSTVGGPTAWAISATLGGSDGDRLPVEVRYTRASNPALVNGAEPINHWSLVVVETSGAAAPPPSVATPVALAATTWSTWRAALQAAVDAVQDIYDRVDARDDIWARQRLFRRRYAFESYYDPDPKKREQNNRWFEPGMVATQRSRRGEAVLVRGAALAVGWGTQVWDETGKNELDLYPMRPLRTAAVGGSSDPDEPLDELIYLQDLDGLPGGAYYTVRGEDCRYAGEIWRVGEDVP